MNRNRIVFVVLSSILTLGAFAPTAFAGDWGRAHDCRGHHRSHGPYYRRDWREDGRRWRQERRDYSSGYRDGYRDARYQHRRYDRHRVSVDDRLAYLRAGPPPRPYWARGQRYHGPVYVVHDDERYHLPRPPYGYRWQRDDRGNLRLVAITTGIISDPMLNH